MKLSLIISSYNQRRRLKLCLQSALHQRLGPNATSYEVIVADDHSTDGTIEMLAANYKDKIIVTQNPTADKTIYTLAENWNHAAKQATGERLIFSNGDIVYIAKFIEAHADPNMRDHILLGPAMRTTPHILPYIDSEKYDYFQVMQVVSTNGWFMPDMRMGLIAHTYNVEDHPWHVYGYNFSLPKKYFDGVNGFAPKRIYGGEDDQIAKAVVAKYGCKCLTNENAMAFHLFHEPTNLPGKMFKSEYNF
jgi:glycosyltransferase involved in cell wall biosynthesis